MSGGFRRRSTFVRRQPLTCEHDRSHISDWILLKFGQDVCAGAVA